MISTAMKSRGTCGKAIGLATIIIAILAATAVRAENSWSVNISEKELKLSHPVDQAWDTWFMGDIGYQRMIERNMPYIELLNDPASTSPITEFHMTIGDSRFNFGPVDGSDLVKLGRTTKGFSLASSTDNSGDEIVVTIGNGGLLPGKLVRFQINLNVDPAYAATYSASFGSSQPDFRTVLFDMNGQNVYDGTTHKSTADNAQAFVIFDPDSKSSTTAFEDEDVAVSQFYNNILRGACCCAKDPVLIFQLDGTAEIPEPSSIGLAMLGLLAGLLLRGRSRRSLVMA